MNRSISRWLTLAGIAGMVIGGCQQGSSSGGAAASAGGKRFKVGVSIPSADHGWTSAIGVWAKKAAKDYPDIDWIIQDAKEPNEQISQLENMKTQGVDALVILATESAPITPIAQKLHDAGILIVNVDRGFTKPIADVYIEGDNKAFGVKSADFIVKKMGGKGKLAILEGIPSTVNTDRVSTAMAVLKANPGIQIVADVEADWNKDKADKAMQNILVANPQIDAIWAADDDMALGAEIALKAAGRDKNIWILGGGCMKQVFDRMMNHDPMFPGEITYPPSMIAYGIETAAVMLRAGKEHTEQYTPRHVLLDVAIVTPENGKGFPESGY